MDFAFLAISIDHLAGTNGLFYLLYGLAVFITGLAVGIELDDVVKSATIARKRACHESTPKKKKEAWLIFLKIFDCVFDVYQVIIWNFSEAK